jgi:hypothetical protein
VSIPPITRLPICGLLASGADWVELAALHGAAGISDSMLSKQSGCRSRGEGPPIRLPAMASACGATALGPRAFPLPGAAAGVRVQEAVHVHVTALVPIFA